MLITPRTYSAAQSLHQISNYNRTSNRHQPACLAGWPLNPPDAESATGMPLIWQTGSVRVGEVIRYTLTYTPAVDEVQPPSTALQLRIKNTSAIPLRAAYLHGPYTLYASCYPDSFDPNTTVDFVDTHNAPQFEPYLKAGGTWNATIPLSSQEERGYPDHPFRQNKTWVVEIVSQVVFSETASVNFEVLVGRDRATLDSVSSNASSTSLKPADLADHWPFGSKGEQLLATKGVYSNSVTLLIDDTASLWNTPRLPTGQETGNMDSEATLSHSDVTHGEPGHRASGPSAPCEMPRKRIHLVVLTHGLHSNLGADMLYIKESIDSASRKAKFAATAGTAEDSHDWQDEDVVVRGFPGNAARTERGIQYLGKRLAKYVLLLTFPDQPHLPRKESKTKTYPNPFTARRAPAEDELKYVSSHIAEGKSHVDEQLAYQITSISFIGHSLGGLVQTYAIAYIQKHCPEFFEKIKPINFVALATPFLGLSNENPMYVRFALDLGLVGRTGQDLGLSWTTPRVRSGWETIIGGKGEPSRSRADSDARTKPLLRVLPSGPAHEVLARFQRRTIYSNLVNDGIVPLRTSSLLFLDWKGLQRVEKTRRENGIVGTMAEWGWAELTGANSKSAGSSPATNDQENKASANAIHAPGTSLQQGDSARLSSSFSSLSAGKGPAHQAEPQGKPDDVLLNNKLGGPLPQPPSSPLNGLFSIFKPKEHKQKQTKILRRSQTLSDSSITADITQQDGSYKHTSHDTVFHAPPRTTFFESAGDLLMPPLPTLDYIVNPASRPRTVLHDRIYHPNDIPPPTARQQTLTAIPSHDGSTTANHAAIGDATSEAGLKVEEKIARAYHRGLSWRKVLVRLEPDAHNNIIVRRMFANAYGWPVVQHLVDSHFGPGSLCSLGPECPREDDPGSPSPPVEIVGGGKS